MSDVNEPAVEGFGASATYVYLTTTGRRTGHPHTIEIWAAPAGRGRLYLMAGNRDRSDWVRNLMKHPPVQVRVGEETREGFARVVQDAAEDALARRLLAAKYQGWREGKPMTNWARTALPIAIEFSLPGEDAISRAGAETRRSKGVGG